MITSAAPNLAGAVALVGQIATVGVGLVFMTAGLGKLRHRALLPGVLANYRLLPAGLVAPLAAVLPVVELALGGLLVSGLLSVPATALAMALLLVFAWAMAVNLRRGRGHIDCGCGHAALRQPLAWPLVARNVALAALLVPALAGLPLPAGTWPLGLTGGVVLFLLFQLFNAIVALAGSPLANARKVSVR
ncbi:MauE/DoxX family redox-associated membrane protein [Novosphingobium rhizosphaerae]|uniref:MauE/DoxX family redox-associated membrane protein n=1 Tax=Novosphingobium rhizosphaerae TaxID=1551649 RepID=UPI0017D9F24B